MFSAAHPDLRDQPRARELAQCAFFIGIDDEGTATRARIDHRLHDAIPAVVGMTHLAGVARDQHRPVASAPLDMFERMFVS
jgi:hypothetical protein